MGPLLLAFEFFRLFNAPYRGGIEETIINLHIGWSHVRLILPRLGRVTVSFDDTESLITGATFDLTGGPHYGDTHPPMSIQVLKAWITSARKEADDIIAKGGATQLDIDNEYYAGRVAAWCVVILDMIEEGGEG